MIREKTSIRNREDESEEREGKREVKQGETQTLFGAGNVFEGRQRQPEFCVKGTPRSWMKYSILQRAKMSSKLIFKYNSIL